MDTPNNRKIYAEIVAKAWTDDAFKAEFLRDPGKTARDRGMTLPPNAVVSVVSSGKGFEADTTAAAPKLELTLPPRPADLNDEAILAFSDTYHGCLGSGGNT